MEIVLAVISALSSVAVAIVGAFALIKQQKVKTETEAESARVNQRAEHRKHESLLSMRMIEANTDLTICIAMNQLNNTNNSYDIENTLKRAQQAKNEYNEYLQEIGKERIL